VVCLLTRKCAIYYNVCKLIQRLRSNVVAIFVSYITVDSHLTPTVMQNFKAEHYSYIGIK
jgi:hypothetical protein